MKLIRIAQNANAVELQGTTLTVYHRTKDQGVAGNICIIGFIAGGGAAYGRGIYSTYDLKSSLQNYNLRSYGGEVIKAHVNTLGFLIFDYDLAKQVYGSNYRLTDQIRNVIGEDNVVNSSLDKKEQWADIERMSQELEGTKWTSDYAMRMSHRYRMGSSGVGGIVFTGRHDGRVCVIFKELLVSPVSHAWIDGKTYKNPTWTDCGGRSAEELQKLQLDEKKAEGFRNSRKDLLDDLGRLGDQGNINIDSANYPDIPEGIFDAALANFLYEDEGRIQRISPTLRTRLKDVIEVEFMVRKLKSAPTVYWNQWQQLDDSIKARIPNELLIDIWEKFALANPGYWGYIPDDIRPAIPKEEEAKHWAKLVKKNPDNWKHVHPDIIEHIEDNLGLNPPSDLEDQRTTLDEERIAETEEIDVPISALGWVQDTISKLNKRAGRLGLRPITHEVVSEDPKNRTQKIKIVGNVPYMKGWKLIARVSRVTDEGGKEFNVVETLSDSGVPESLDLENADMRCDDCGHKRKRKDCYIVKNESATEPHGVKRVVYQIGQHLMIGSTCLGDFIGDTGSKTSPEGIAKYAQQFRQMLTLFKEGSEYQNKDDKDIRRDFKNKGAPIAFFLTKVMQLDRQFGFVGRGEAYKSGKEATANLAWQMCIDLDVDKKYSKGVDASDLATIYSALAWIAEIPEPQDGDTAAKGKDFLYNLKKSCELGVVFGKKRKGNIGTVAWLPTAYKRNVEENIDYEKISGEPGEEIFFGGSVIGKRPVLTQVSQQVMQGTNVTTQVSQQVMQGTNVTQNYILAQSPEERTVAWLEDAPIQADMNQPVYVKGKVQDNLFVNGLSATVLQDVEEISEEDFENVRPQVEKRLKELEEKKEPEVEDAAATPLDGSPQGNYQDGAQIVERYTIDGKKSYGNQDLYFLKDDYSQKVSAFTNLDLGEKGDKVTLSATVKFNKGYTNLENVQVIPDGADDSQAVPAQPQAVPAQPAAAPQQAVDYQDGQDIEDDFTITDIRSANYGSMLYNMLDSAGRKVSSFIKGNIGNVGETVRLKAKVQIKGQYVNLQRVKVVPRQTQAPTQPSQQVTAPTVQTTKPTTSLPVQPTGTQPPPDDDDTTAASNDWYGLSKQAGIFDRFKPSNWMGGKDQPEPVPEPDQQAEDESEISDLSQPQQQNYKEPHEVDLDRAYDMFADSYQKATGKAWEKSKFLNRSGNWHFFGDEYGYIAVRPQRSGLYKLVGIAGDDTNPTQKGKSLIKGFRDLMAEGKPTWGMVSQDLKGMAERMGMKSPPPMFTKQFMKYIPSEIFGGAEIKNILPDGGIEFVYQDIGATTKYLIANDAYFNWLKQGIDTNQNIPKPAKFLLKKVLDRMARSRAFIKTATVSSFDHVKNSIDLSEV